MGWRYLTITLGAITFVMFLCRFFLFHLYESPKFLLSRGRQEEAVGVVHAIAKKNKTKTWLTVEIMNEIGGHPDVVADQALSTMEIIKRQLSKFSGERIGPLFNERKLGVTSMSSVLVCVLLLLTGHSRSSVVLLDDHWNGISSFQRILASVSGCLWRRHSSNDLRG